MKKGKQEKNLRLALNSFPYCAEKSNKEFFLDLFCEHEIRKLKFLVFNKKDSGRHKLYNAINIITKYIVQMNK